MQSSAVERRCACAGVFGQPSSRSPVVRGLIRDVRTYATRADNRGNLRLYLDSASVYQWEKFAPREAFYGVTCNPLILKRDEVPQCNLKVYNILAKQAFDLGYQEIQLQAWGRDQKEIASIGADIAAIDSRVVVKIPITEGGAVAAAQLKRQKAMVTLTALYSSHQALAALGVGADYAAPYLHRMNEAGKQGFKEVLEMNDMCKRSDSGMRILVASIRTAADIAALAAQGCDTFTIAPQTADELYQDPATASAANEFENAVRSLGGY